MIFDCDKQKEQTSRISEETGNNQALAANLEFYTLREMIISLFSLRCHVYPFWSVSSLSRAQLVPKSATIEDRFHPLPRSPLPFIYCSPSILYQALVRTDAWATLRWLAGHASGYLDGSHSMWTSAGGPQERTWRVAKNMAIRWYDIRIYYMIDSYVIYPQCRGSTSKL